MGDDVDLLHKGREAGTETTAEDNDLVFLRAEAGAIAERKLELNRQQLPRAILDVVAFDRIKPLLAIIATECVDELLVDDRG